MLDFIRCFVFFLGEPCRLCEERANDRSSVVNELDANQLKTSPWDAKEVATGYDILRRERGSDSRINLLLRLAARRHG